MTGGRCVLLPDVDREPAGGNQMDEITVYHTWDESFAEMAVDLLRAEGINARAMAGVTRSVYPFTMDGLGEISIIVAEKDAQEALDILSARFSETEIAEIGEEECGEEDEGGFDTGAYDIGKYRKYLDNDE
jgi:hypothetical protein